jgi:hypothetical protein
MSDSYRSFVVVAHNSTIRVWCRLALAHDVFSGSGLYYKPMMIVNDDSRVINKLETSLTDEARVVIYDRHVFIAQATDFYGCTGPEHCIAYMLVHQQGLFQAQTMQEP